MFLSLSQVIVLRFVTLGLHFCVYAFVNMTIKICDFGFESACVKRKCKHFRNVLIDCILCENNTDCVNDTVTTDGC